MPLLMKTINAQELKKKIEQLDPDLTIIAIVSQEIFDDCHIPSSQNIPFAHIMETVASWDKEKEIIIYGASTSNSHNKEAYELMTDLGFSNIYVYQGGIKDWFAHGFTRTGVCLLEYLHK